MKEKCKYNYSLLTVAMSPNLHKKVKAHCKQREISASSFVRQCVFDYFDERQCRNLKSVGGTD